MTDEPRTQVKGKKLWRELQRDPVEHTELTGADANLLAAFADGTLAGTEREALEARLADDPVLLETLLAALDDEPAPLAMPEGLAERAKAVATGTAPARPYVVASRPANENRRGRVAWLEWAAAAVALIVVSAVGFELGSDNAGRRAGKDVAAANGGELELPDLDGGTTPTGFSLEEADDAFNGGEQ